MRQNVMRTFFSFMALFSFFYGFSQSNGWTIDPYEDRYFIENRGQYGPIDGKEVVASIEDKGNTVYFTSTGFAYQGRKARAIPTYLLSGRREGEPNNEGESPSRMVWDTLEIAAQWHGANPNQAWLAGPQAPVFHFAVDGAQIMGAKAYTELTCGELYPGVDLVYSFHEVEGIKYSLTVHAGGDPDQIALVYRGMDTLFLDHGGHLHARLGDAGLMDHAPTAHLLESGTPVAIQFVLSGDTVRFHVGDYDHRQTLYIDPWIINPGFTTDTKAFDVGWDCSGNVYAFGGSNPWKVRKFSSAGALIWSYNTNHTSWYGDMISDDLGNIYLVEGCCNGNRQKLNSAGAVQWNINNGVYEFWRLAFSCDWSRLTMATAYSASASVVPAMSLSTISTASGAISGAVVVSASEPRALVPAASGNYYVLTSVGNELLARNNAYGAVYNVGNGYSLLYNGPLYSNGINTTQGQNGIAVYGNFIFTTNGATLMKRNITTGALISSVAIPGGVSEQYSGVTVDNCGNVYVGGNGNVYQYDVNLAPVTAFPVTGAVYDVAVSGTAQLLSCGNGFLSSQTAPCVAPCPSCVILPAGLNGWEATLNERNQVDLRWSVEDGASHTRFTIERSADGSHFSEWNSTFAGVNNYWLVDEAPLEGYSWYRLALHTQSGTVSHSPAKQVWRESSQSRLTAYPNPAQTLVHVQLPIHLAPQAILQVINAQGQVTLEKHLSAEDSPLLDMDISSLQQGIYTLRLMGMDCKAVKLCVGNAE